MSIYRAIHQAIERHQEQCDTDGDALRLMKLSEEVGEVMEAFIGYHGANKRKGATHGALDIANELCDVVITAMVALHDWVDRPEEYLKARQAGLVERVKKEGS